MLCIFFILKYILMLFVGEVFSKIAFENHIHILCKKFHLVTSNILSLLFIFLKNNFYIRILFLIIIFIYLIIFKK